MNGVIMMVIAIVVLGGGYLLCKAVFIFIAIVVCALWAFEFRIAAVVVLLIDYIFDFITRRCPFCGKHFSIVLTVKDRCPFCGKLFE